MTTDLLPELDFADLLESAPFSERHHRLVSAPIEEVWPHCLAVSGSEVRCLGPLLALRRLPAVLRNLPAAPRGRRSSSAEAPVPMIELFARSGFVVLRRDVEPVDGRAVVIIGAAGRFWSATQNAAVDFDGPADFLAFAEPGMAKTVARLEAIDEGDGTVRIETETRVVGTDPASTRRFAPYWALIRLPSGLIRRSWLAAIDRRIGT